MERDDAQLILSSDEMRSLGYRVVDMLVAQVESLSGQRVSTVATRDELTERIGRTIPRTPSPAGDVLDAVERDILAHIAHVDHPRFFAYIPGPGNFVGVMADALAAGFNVFAGAWPVASGPSYIELVVIDWLRGLCGLPPGAGGLFVSGGSIANLTALIVARDRLSEHERSRGVIYYSDQTHSSVTRALDVLGVAAERRRPLRPTGRFSSLRADDVAAAVARDREEGWHPWCVVANAGATSTGALDDLDGIAELARSERLWMHVDAAYGGGWLLSATGRDALEGIGGADSITLDPHKWLFQPFDIGCVLVRDAAVLEQSFESIPAYLRDSAGTGEVNFRDRGIELTRPFRALKLWMTLQVFGTDAIERAIERGEALASVASDRLRASGLWKHEGAIGGWMAIVIFRYAAFAADEATSDDLHRRLARLLVEDGTAMLSTTEIDGRVCLRLCTINPRTTDEDIHETIECLERLAARLAR
jgi:glutamate/tyrosine decarboxylase-like PLP-dependent enzyme